jgi:hypothetical protein
MAGGPVRQPYAGVDFIPCQGPMNSATVLYSWHREPPEEGGARRGSGGGRGVSGKEQGGL